MRDMARLYYRKLYDENNDKTPLFILHTIPLDGTYFERSFDGVNFSFPVYIIDLPSHGKSDDIDNLHFDNMAKEIEKLREDLSINKLYIMGHGVGGFVAMNYAYMYESKLQGMILSNTAPDSSYRIQMAWNIRDRYTKVILQALSEYGGKTDDKSLRVKFTQSLSVHFKPTNHEAAKLLLDTANRVATDAYVKIAKDIIPRHNMREKLRKLKIPTLIIGCTDDVWPGDAINLLKTDIEHADMIAFKGGHFPMLEGANKYWSEIEKWLHNN